MTSRPVQLGELSRSSVAWFLRWIRRSPVDRWALSLLQDLRDPVEQLLAGAHRGACDCGSAKRALHYIDELERSLRAGEPLGEDPYGIDETLDDVFCCAATHASRKNRRAISTARQLVGELCELSSENMAKDDHLGSPQATTAPGLRRCLVAERIASAAALVLPAQHSGRYRDEYRSELYDLALEGTSRWEQACHALRLLDRAWVLRAELRDTAIQRVRS